ncbi:MAG: BF2992 family fimbrillin-A clan protein [Paraprevotella sp.]|nr:BF2992 family fimbrillin-A clan protein [Paraprevotella sp.]
MRKSDNRKHTGGMRWLLWAAMAVCGAIWLGVGVSGCSSETEETAGSLYPDVPEGMVAIRFSLGGQSYLGATGGSTRASTRAVVDDDQAITESKLDTNKLLPLDDGTTVWIAAQKASAKASDIGKPDDKGNYDPAYFTVEGTAKLTSFVVHSTGDTDASGTPITYLYPCTVDSMGNVLTEESQPFFLSAPGYFLFTVVSPARKLNGDTCLSIKNGQYVLANDTRYKATRPAVVDIQTAKAGESRVQFVQLNPIMNQTARIRVVLPIAAAEKIGIHDFGMLQTGVEVSGLQTDPDPGEYNWSFNSALKAQMGNKNGTLRITTFTKEVVDYGQGPTECYMGDASVLPTNSVSLPVTVLLNLRINGVPTSYEMMLNEKKFLGGYSYNYIGQIDRDANGMHVMSWQQAGWSENLHFDNINDGGGINTKN